MDTKHLITFVTIAKQQSFLKASMQLNYAPSTLTSHIAQLEQELGVKLVETSGRRTRLTSDGTAFLEYANKILDLVSDARQSLNNSKSLHGKIVIGITESIAFYKSDHLFSDFLTRYPDVRLSIKVQNSEFLPPQVKNGNMDVAFLYSADKSYPAGLKEIPLFEDVLRFTVSPTHRLMKKEHVTVRDLSREIFLYQHEDSFYYQITQDLFKAKGLEFNNELQIDSNNLIKKYVREGKGVAVLPVSATEQDVQAGNLAYLDFGWEDLILKGKLLLADGKHRSQALDEFIRYAEEYYADSKNR